MKYLTQKQTTKLWSGLALAALLLTALLWCLTSTVTFTPKQAIERAAKIEQIAPLTLLDKKEVPGFRLLLTGNQDNLVLLGWSDRYHHNLRNASNHLLSLDLTAGDPALQALPCAVWSAAGTDRTLLALIGTSNRPDAVSAYITAAPHAPGSETPPSSVLWCETVPLTQRSAGDAFFWLVRDEIMEGTSGVSLLYTITLLNQDGTPLTTLEQEGGIAVTRFID